MTFDPRDIDHVVSETDARRSYVRVLILWVVVLVALFAFQEYFS